MTGLTRRLLRGAAGLLACALLAAACTSGEPAAVPSPSPVEYPDWIERVYPPPGSELSVTETVQVDHDVVTSERAVRLTIDGVDMTTYADQADPGLLVYDPDHIDAQPPVELDSGEHEAVVELLDVRPATDEGGVGYEILDVLDTFTWTFTIL
jgi:hypothetical protein